MEQKFFHGELQATDLAQALVAEFDRGHLRAQIIGAADQLAVQIGTRPGSPSGGQTALTFSLQTAQVGALVRLSHQEWLGTAALIGQTTIAAT